MHRDVTGHDAMGSPLSSNATITSRRMPRVTRKCKCNRPQNSSTRCDAVAFGLGLRGATCC